MKFDSITIHGLTVIFLLAISMVIITRVSASYENQLRQLKAEMQNECQRAIKTLVDVIDYEANGLSEESALKTWQQEFSVCYQ